MVGHSLSLCLLAHGSVCRSVPRVSRSLPRRYSFRHASGNLSKKGGSTDQWTCQPVHHRERLQGGRVCLRASSLEVMYKSCLHRGPMYRHLHIHKTKPNAYQAPSRDALFTTLLMSFHFPPILIMRWPPLARRPSW